MQSLKSRFNGNSQEVVKYAREFGVMAAMEHYDVKDYIAMRNYLKDQAPDTNFQVAKVEASTYAGPDAFDKLVEAFLRTNDKLKAENATLVAENTELKRQIDYYKGIQSPMTLPKVEAVFEYCTEEE